MRYLSELTMRFLCILVLLFVLFSKTAFSKEVETATIALVGPMTGADASLGQNMTRAVSLYIENINKEAGAKGPKIELAIYDDQGQVEQARKIARTIADEQKALLVISHLPASHEDIGDQYRELKLPIITGSGQEKNDFNNPWFFSTLFNDRSQGVFIANYLKRIMSYQTAHIIYDEDRDIIDRAFSLTFGGLNGVVKKRWKIRKDHPIKDEINTILQYLFMEENPADVIFLATGAQKSAEILAELRRKGINYKIFGTHTLTDPAFLQHLSLFPEEQFDPGYFSNDVMATSPIIYDVAGKKTQVFKEQYQTRFQTSPSWVEATFFDATLLAVNAIQKTWSKKNDVKKTREQIKNYLNRIDDPKNALDGLDGPLYFNAKGELVSNIAVGQFSKEKLISTFTQLKPVKDINLVVDLKQKIASEDIVLMDSQYLEKTDVIFTGIDFVEVSDLDLKKSTYTLDFYLWFRFKGNVQAGNIEFINQEKPISLGAPFQRSVENGIIHEVYRIKAKFHNVFDFSSYPVDEHDLILQFYNKNGFIESIFYVRDDLGLSQNPKQLEQIQKSTTLTSWTATNLLFFQDHLMHSTFGDPLFFTQSPEISYSRFNAQIHIKRNIVSFVIKNFLPLFIIVILMYLVTFTDFTTCITVYVGALLTTIFEHIRVSGELPGIGYIIALDYLFYSIYVLIVVQITISIIADNNSKAGKENFSKKLLFANKIIYPISIIIGILFFQHNYKLFPFHAREIPYEVHKAVGPKTQMIPEQSNTLTLGTWLTDVGNSLDNVLKEFNKQNTFKVVSKPIEYNSYQSILTRQLKSNIGPDIFYLEGIESLTQPIIDHGYTAPIDNFALNHTLTNEERRIWTGKDGKLHAIPAFGIANGVYYNKDIFKKLKLSVPTTWEEFLEVGHRLKKAGYIALANGSKEYWSSANAFFISLAPNFIGGKAGRLLYSTGERCFNDQHVIDLFAAIKDIKELLPTDFIEYSYYDGRALFLSQEAAMWISASWELGNLSQKGPFSWGVFALPAPQGKTTTVPFYIDAAFAINAKSKKYQEGRRFLDWVMTKEFEDVWQNNMTGSFLLNPNSALPTNPQAKEFFELTRKHPTDFRWFISSGTPDFYELVIEATNKVLAGSMTPKQAADFLQNSLVTWYRPAQLCLQKKAKQL